MKNFNDSGTPKSPFICASTLCPSFDTRKMKGWIEFKPFKASEVLLSEVFSCQNYNHTEQQSHLNSQHASSN